MRCSFALAAALALVTAAPGLADETARVVSGDTLLTLTAQGKAERTPDIATLSAGVETTGATAAEAMATNAQAMTRAIAALKAAGIEDRDIQTGSIALSPAYAEPAPGKGNDAPPRITGYTARDSVDLRERRLDRLGKIVDTLVAAGANQIDGPSFGIDKPDAALDEARTAAVAAARARADLYARAAGLHVVRILAIREAGSVIPRPMPMMMRAAAAPMASTPVEPGETSLAATVTVDFELAP